MFASNHVKSFNELIRSSIIFSLLRRLQESENRLFVNYFYTDIHFRSPTIFSLDHPFFPSYEIIFTCLQMYV